MQINKALFGIVGSMPVGTPGREKTIDKAANTLGRLVTTQVQENYEQSLVVPESELVQDGRHLLRGLQAQMALLRVRERLKSGLQKSDEQ
jgi:hypothetical protein